MHNTKIIIEIYGMLYKVNKKQFKAIIDAYLDGEPYDHILEKCTEVGPNEFNTGLWTTGYAKQIRSDRQRT